LTQNYDTLIYYYQNSDTAYTRRAISRYYFGDSNNAIKDAERALEINPDNEDAHKMLYG